MKIGKIKFVISAILVAALVPNLFMPPIINEDTPRVPAVFVPHAFVSWLNGKYALNDSTVVDVYGGDLGIVTKYQGRFYYIFGDTFGFNGTDWRSNTMAWSTDTNPVDGVVVNGWIVNDSTHLARALFEPKHKINGAEYTTIPTTAITDGNKFYIYYMDINNWGVAGVYNCNNASIAASSDGIHFTRISNMSWPGDSNFVMFAHVLSLNDADNATGYEYLLATPAGRYYSAYLLRVPQGQELNQSAYSYYVGLDGQGNPQWNDDMSSAVSVFDRPVGEMSVMWDKYLQRYVAMYIEHYTATIVLRTSKTLWGPWSDQIGVLNYKEFWGLYGSFMQPDLVENEGQVVYFVVSQWWPTYATCFWKANLTSLLQS
ncbi:MAG TPA: DUF4185 domain-containing protein [Candidatus Lokiarchaeia archaeon]|nr:DUF4185 domain-containing protein [Candidatus Lokiarchaeia archaeon]